MNLTAILRRYLRDRQPAATAHARAVIKRLKGECIWSRTELEFRDTLLTSAKGIFDPLDHPTRRAVLICGHQGHELLELWLAVCLRGAGYRVELLIPGTPRYFDLRKRAAGLFAFRPLKRVPIKRTTRYEIFLEGVPSLSSLAAVFLTVTLPARYAVSTFMRYFKTSQLPSARSRSRRQLLTQISESVSWYETFQSELDWNGVDFVVGTDVGYTPTGELFEVARSHGKRLVSWNLNALGTSVLVKQSSDFLPHPYALSPETWKKLCQDPDRALLERKAIQELETAYSRGSWFKAVQAAMPDLDGPNATYRELPAGNTDRAVIGVFPHIGWDGSFFWGEDLFDTYDDWFREVVLIARSMPDVEWIVKLHPAHLAKTGGAEIPDDALGLLAWVASAPNVTVVPSDDPTPPTVLLKRLSACMTVRGTVGLEAAALGIPTITAGTGRFENLGFTIDPPTRTAFYETISQVAGLKPMEERDIANARLYLWGSMFGQGLELDGIELEVDQNSKQLVPRFLGTTEGTIRSLRVSMEAFRGWLNSASQEPMQSRESRQQTRRAP